MSSELIKHVCANYQQCTLQVTPKEVSDITFAKPTHKRRVQFVSCAEKDSETPPAKKIPESGPQDASRLPVQKLLSALFEVVPQACLFTVVEPPLNSEETLPTIEQAQDQLEVPMPTSCVSSPMDDECTHEQGDEQRGEHVDKQSEEQSAEHVGEQNEEQSAELAGEQNEEQSTELAGEQSEEQPTEPPQLISEPTDHLKAGGGAESNLSNIVPLPEHYKKFSISDEYDLPSTAEQLFYSLNFSSEECSRIEHVTWHQRNTNEWYRQRQGRLTASDFHKIFSM